MFHLSLQSPTTHQINAVSVERPIRLHARRGDRISFQSMVEIAKQVISTDERNTVELRSSGPKSNGNLTPTDLTFGAQTSFSLTIYIG